MSYTQAFHLNQLIFAPHLQAEKESKNLRHEIEARHGGPHIHSIKNVSELDSISIFELKQVHQQLLVDVGRVEKVCLQCFCSPCDRDFSGHMKMT